MIMRIRFLPEAEAELAEARIWYGRQREGLDIALMLRIEEALQRIIEAPYTYQIVYLHLRRIVVRQFLFAIFYKATENEIVVFAIYQARRDPKRFELRE
jgi:plasmid stabilization system protein ParE